MYEHEDLNKLLIAAGIEVPITLAERCVLLLQTINDVKFKKMQVSTCALAIDIAENAANEEVTDEMEEEQEIRKHELRDLKNSFRMQTHFLNKEMVTTDEV